MTKLTRIIAIILSVQLILLPSVGVKAAYVGGQYISSAGACVMDYDTGEVLYEYNGYSPRVPASMTKIMNVYCVYEAIRNGEISLDTVVPISKKVYDISRNSTYTNVVPLYYNQTYTVNEMISVVVAHSASGAAVALAELVGGGSEAAFVQRMNNKAAEMGINAHYYDSCGIASNQITPVGMATLARNIIRDYPDILNRSSLKSVYFHGNTYKTTNRLLDSYYYAGADGLKTGTTSAAGYCFCGTAVRNGRRIITVTMSSSSSNQRFVDTARLMDYGFAAIAAKADTLQYTNMRVLIDGMEIPTFVYLGSDSAATIIAEHLSGYGFNTRYDEAARTLYISRDPGKQPAPMDTTPYKGKTGSAYTINRATPIKVVINDGVTSHEIKTTYNLNGYVAIPADEFRSIYQTDWVAAESTLYINTAISAALPAVGSELLSTKANDTIQYTDMRVLIDGMEMPTFLYRSTDHAAMIIAEHLAGYGFNIIYDEAAKTLYVNRDSGKQPAPMDISPYKGKTGNAYNIDQDNPIRVVINDGITSHEIKTTYNLNGYVAIPADEFQGIYRTTWSNEENALYINTDFSTARPFVGDELLSSESAFIMDYDNGQELYAFDADTRRPVASIAKMMSVYVILDAIKAGEVSLDTIVPISENVYKLSRVEDYKMMVNLEYDEVYTLDEMIDMIVIDSAAACVTAVAELLCGTEAEFAVRMNQKAYDLGIGSVFYNGTGVCLNPETESENLMSAREVAIMTRHMIQDYPDILERTKRSSVEFHGQTYYNLNKMFTDYYYKGADGFKNGMTDAAGYCMCGTAELGGKRLITVTLPSDSNEARFTDTIKMFDYGFSLLGVDTTGATVPPEVSSLPPAENVQINIDGNYLMTFDGAQPYYEGEILMVPARQLMETLLKNVGWNESTGNATISDGTISLIISPGSTAALRQTANLIDGTVAEETITMPVSSSIVGSTLFVPVREVCEAFDLAVIWDYDAGILLIIAGVC